MIKGIVFDLDGTLYCGEKAVPGALDTVCALINSGCQVLYLTNSSIRTRQQTLEKLLKIGFPAKLEQVYCGGHAICCFLKLKKIGHVHLVGPDNFKEELVSFGIEVSQSLNAPAVVAVLDVDITYNKITAAAQAIHNGAVLIVANTDPWYPAEGGKRMPGCGAIVGALVGATGHQPDAIVGKPSPFMLEMLCREHGLLPAEICVAGDVPESDIKMADNFGCRGVLFDPENVFPEFKNRISTLSKILEVTQ